MWQERERERGREGRGDVYVEKLTEIVVRVSLPAGRLSHTVSHDPAG